VASATLMTSNPASKQAIEVTTAKKMLRQQTSSKRTHHPSAQIILNPAQQNHLANRIDQFELTILPSRHYHSQSDYNFPRRSTKRSKLLNLQLRSIYILSEPFNKFPRRVVVHFFGTLPIPKTANMQYAS
jgi:hypothetical protein